MDNKKIEQYKEIIRVKESEIKELRNTIAKKEKEISRIRGNILEEEYNIKVGDVINFRGRIGIITSLEGEVFWRKLTSKKNKYVIEETLIIDNKEKIIKLANSYEEFINEDVYLLKKGV